MKKIYKYLCVSLLTFVVLVNNVFAAGYSVSTTSNSVTIGNSVTLKISGSDIAGKFSISTSDSSVVSISTGSVWIDNNTQSITLKTNKVGSATITIKPTDVTSYSGDTITGNKSVTITVKAKPVTPSGGGSSSGGSGSSSNKPAKVKSSNNYLSSLTVDGYDLDNSFDKETLEYSVIVKEGTEKVKINAQLADSSASVTGLGEVSVSEGVNSFDLVVTAENGSKRTYVLKVTVKEYQPINVDIGRDKYSVVRKKKDLPEISEYFTEKEITIGEDKVDGYYNEELGYDIVGLKDSKGKISYYIYKNNKYELYNEQVFNGMVLRVLDKELDGGYKKTSFNYNDTKIDSYQEVKLDIIKNTYALEEDNDISGNNFYLFYAINMETGKEELYQYDSVEKTVQRYNTLILDMYKERSDKYYLYLLCGILTLGLVFITFSIMFIRSSRKIKRLKRKNRDIELNKNNKKKDIDKNKKKKNVDMEDDF